MSPSSTNPQGLAAVVIPVPDSDTAAGELEAVLTNVILPASAPATVGAKTAVNVALCPTVRVSGNVRPVME